MPVFPSQPSTAGHFKHILEMYGLNISLSHMSQTLHQEVILMLTQISIQEKQKAWNQFPQFRTPPVVETETKLTIMYK